MQNGGNPCVASYKSKRQTQECDEWYLLMSQLPGILKGQKKLRHPLISRESRGAPKCHPQDIKPPFNSHENICTDNGHPFFCLHIQSRYRNPSLYRWFDASLLRNSRGSFYNTSHPTCKKRFFQAYHHDQKHSSWHVILLWLSNRRKIME